MTFGKADVWGVFLKTQIIFLKSLVNYKQCKGILFLFFLFN